MAASEESAQLSMYDDFPLSTREIVEREHALMPVVKSLTYYLRGDGPSSSGGGELAGRPGCFHAANCISWMISETEDPALESIETRAQGLALLQDLVYADLLHTVGRRKDPHASTNPEHEFGYNPRCRVPANIGHV